MGRPVGVWITLIFYLGYSGFGLWGLGYVLTNIEAASPYTQARYTGLNLVDVLWMTSIQIMPVIGGVALFMLMRAAQWVFAAYLGLLIFGLLWQMATNGPAILATGGLTGMMVALGIAAQVNVYIRKLAANGTLS